MRRDKWNVAGSQQVHWKWHAATQATGGDGYSATWDFQAQ